MEKEYGIFCYLKGAEAQAILDKLDSPTSLREVWNELLEKTDDYISVISVDPMDFCGCEIDPDTGGVKFRAAKTYSCNDECKKLLFDEDRQIVILYDTLHIISNHVSFRGPDLSHSSESGYTITPKVNHQDK